MQKPFLPPSHPVSCIIAQLLQAATESKKNVQPPPPPPENNAPVVIDLDAYEPDLPLHVSSPTDSIIPIVDADS